MLSTPSLTCRDPREQGSTPCTLSSAVPGGGAEPRTAGLGAALLPESLSRASPQVRFPLPPSGLRSCTACVPGTRCPRRGGSPAQDAFPQPVFSAGTNLSARHRSALRLRPPGLRAQSGAGSPGSLREHRGPPDRCPPPGAPEVWNSPWGHPVLSLSSGSRAVRAPAAAEPELAAPEPPAAHPLPLPLRLPLLGCGGDVAR